MSSYSRPVRTSGARNGRRDPRADDDRVRRPRIDSDHVGAVRHEEDVGAREARGRRPDVVTHRHSRDGAERRSRGRDDGRRRGKGGARDWPAAARRRRVERVRADEDGEPVARVHEIVVLVDRDASENGAADEPEAGPERVVGMDLRVRRGAREVRQDLVQRDDVSARRAPDVPGLGGALRDDDDGDQRRKQRLLHGVLDRFRGIGTGYAVTADGGADSLRFEQARKQANAQYPAVTINPLVRSNRGGRSSRKARSASRTASRRGSGRSTR